MLDFQVSGGGTVYLLTPKTPAAKAWASEFLPDDVQRLGDGIAVEHRYLDHIVEGIQSFGLEVARVH